MAQIKVKMIKYPLGTTPYYSSFHRKYQMSNSMKYGISDMFYVKSLRPQSDSES